MTQIAAQDAQTGKTIIIPKAEKAEVKPMVAIFAVKENNIAYKGDLMLAIPETQLEDAKKYDVSLCMGKYSIGDTPMEKNEWDEMFRHENVTMIDNGKKKYYVTETPIEVKKLIDEAKKADVQAALETLKENSMDLVRKKDFDELNTAHKKLKKTVTGIMEASVSKNI